MDGPEKLPVTGRVVWITREGAEGDRKARIGNELIDEDVTITARIETYLSIFLTSERFNHSP